MTTEDDDAKGGGEPTFTRAQMAKMVNAQVREKVTAALAEYGDLDELRKKAAEADKQASQLDRIEQQLKAAEERASKAERDGLVRRVADELGISMRLAGKLDGKTYDELIEDGRATMEDLGIKPKGNKSKTSTAKQQEGADDDADAEDGDDAQQQDDEPKAKPTAPVRAARPRENLRSGATRTPAEPEETNPLKLVADIPRT